MRLNALNYEIGGAMAASAHSATAYRVRMSCMRFEVGQGRPYSVVLKERESLAR
jgi:hypothetical protein